MITGPEKETVTVQTVIHNPSSPAPNRVDGFVESNGYVSMEAEHFSQAVGSSAVTWQRIPDLGRTLSAMTSLPVTGVSQTPGGEAPRLEYSLYLADSEFPQ